MNADENEIYEFLKRLTGYVSVIEVSRSVGARRRFIDDRLWAKPTLRRMEAEGWLESNIYGEYRLKKRKEGDTNFLEAIHMPNASLGDTTIISLKDVSKTDALKKAGQPQAEEKQKFGT